MDRLIKMMTIREVARTGILAENAIRSGIKQGWIPCVKAGNRVYINYYKLAEILEGRQKSEKEVQK